MRNDDLLWAMALTFFTTAIFSFGGIATMIPEIHRQAVDIRGWLGNDDFATAFALSQIAPGPNILLMSMIGWRVAGWAGLAVATLATIVPTSLIALLAGRGEARIANTRWYRDGPCGHRSLARRGHCRGRCNSHCLDPHQSAHPAGHRDRHRHSRRAYWIFLRKNLQPDCAKFGRKISVLQIRT